MGFLIFALVVFVVCAFVGASMAKSQGRNPTLWAIICVLTGIFGIIILAVLGDEKKVSRNNANADNSYGFEPSRTLPKPEIPAAVVETKKYDVEKWKVLTEVDPDIAEASRWVSEHGPQYVDELATKYLTLSDKNYLSAIVDNVLDQVRKDAEEKERLSQERASLAGDARLRSVVLLQDYLEKVKQNDGKDPDFHDLVKSVVVYEGSARVFENEAIKVIFEDGRAMLRGRLLKRLFKSEAEADAWGS